ASPRGADCDGEPWLGVRSSVVPGGRLITVEAIHTRRMTGSQAALAFLARMQQRHRRYRHGRRLPAGDGPGAGARLRVVGDTGEPAAQLDGGRQFALLIKNGPDRGGVSFGDDKHDRTYGVPRGARQAGLARSTNRCDPTYVSNSPARRA